jgi:hypothetical protein
MAWIIASWWSSNGHRAAGCGGDGSISLRARRGLLGIRGLRGGPVAAFAAGSPTAGRRVCGPPNGLHERSARSRIWAAAPELAAAFGSTRLALGGRPAPARTAGRDGSTCLAGPARLLLEAHRETSRAMTGGPGRADDAEGSLLRQRSRRCAAGARGPSPSTERGQDAAHELRGGSRRHLELHARCRPRSSCVSAPGGQGGGVERVRPPVCGRKHEAAAGVHSRSGRLLQHGPSP